MVKHELLFDNINSSSGGSFDDVDFDISEGAIDYDPDPAPITPPVQENGRSYKNNRRASTGSSSSSGSSSGSSSRTRHKAGHTSYADLITRAILSTPESRMTLSQIYDWMVEHVNGLQEQRSLHSSKGWKNAVRHTLSINPRFKRVQRQGRPGLWMLDSQSFAHRFHYALPANTGSGPTQPIIEAACLVDCGGGRFESDHFNLSPTINTSSPTFNFHQENLAVQTINVINEDESLGCITLQSPIRIKGKRQSEACTQTDSTFAPISTSDRSSCNYNFNRFQAPRLHAKFESNTMLTQCPPETLHNSSSEKFQWTQQLLCLPDDLQDISLDPSLNCNGLLRDQYWF